MYFSVCGFTFAESDRYICISVITNVSGESHVGIVFPHTHGTQYALFYVVVRYFIAGKGVFLEPRSIEEISMKV